MSPFFTGEIGVDVAASHGELALSTKKNSVQGLAGKSFLELEINDGLSSVEEAERRDGVIIDDAS
jgi:hypothetical protein